MFGLSTINRMNERAAPIQAARKAATLEEKEKRGEAKRRDYFAAFHGSEALFNAAWRKYREADRAGNAIKDVLGFLNETASTMVNNPRSPYYLHG